MLKEWITAKALTEAFKIGLRNDLPENIAKCIEKELDIYLGIRKSEEVQREFEYFLIQFTTRIINKLREDK